MPLDAKAVTAWLKGQKAAELRIEQERREFLRSLSPEDALRIYCSLSERTHARRDEPSPLLVKVREVMRRYEAVSRGCR
jgi:hypothetical protein